MKTISWTLLVASTLLACKPGAKPGTEYMPDMARGPAYKAFAPNLATRDGLTLQRPVVGSIARGHQPFHYETGVAEAERAGRELVNPFRSTPPILEKGKALYQIYCLVCHGAEGKGDGPIAKKIPTPPPYRSERLLGYAPGRIFHVITMGANKMPSYAAQLAPDERWMVATYVRATLQGLPEPAKVEPTKVEPAKAEPIKAEPIKVEPAKVEPIKVEPAAAGSTQVRQ